MPPKTEKKTAKVKEDKTFGMKNKNKSAKVQKFIQQVQTADARSGKNKDELLKEKERADKLKAKAELEKRQKADNELFQVKITQPKVPFGADPKTFLCAFFKAGVCEKGAKCKFSHDKNVERKTAKVNLYEDTRDKASEKATDTMDKWDEEKLRNVVSSKGNMKTTTDIVCKFFIQAIEDQKYGWFWECPNGLECKYRHALPPGFVLKSEKKAREEAAKKEVISLEDFLETERHKLKAPLTPVTPESFAIWKKSRVDKKVAEADAREKAKAVQRAAGKITGMSGKDLFNYSADMLYQEDDDEEDDWDLQRYMADRDQNARQEEEEEEEDGDGGDTSEDESSDVGDADVAGSAVSVGEGMSKLDVNS